MTRQVSRLAQALGVAATATVLIAALPGAASASPAKRWSPPTITAHSVPNGFVDPGSKFSDTATFNAALGPVTGTATFFLCGPRQPSNDRNVFPDGCRDGGTRIGDPVPISGNAATSAEFTDQTRNGFSAAYCWRVEYTPASGSPYEATNFTNSTSQCVIAVLQVAIETVSTPTGGGVAPGTAAYDTATITGKAGVRAPSKVVSFFLCGPAQVTEGKGCVTGGTLVDQKRGVGTVVSRTTTRTMDPGTYCWRVEYAGGFSPPDSFAPGSHTNWTTECFTVVIPQRQPTLTTLSVPTAGIFPAGTPVYDTAKVTGEGTKPTGTVTFFLCGPDLVTVGVGCASGGTMVGTDELDADGVAVSPTTNQTNETGTYCWRAEYSGDQAYTGTKHTNATNECFGILVALPLKLSSTTTTSSPTGRQDIKIDDLPLSLFDTAVVLGDGVVPTGTVTFFLCGPQQGTLATKAGCPTGGSQIGQPAALNAGGIATSATIFITKAGSYCWRAEYSGDSVYATSQHTNGASECMQLFVVEAGLPIKRPRPLPATGTDPVSASMGLAFVAIGLVLSKLSRRAPEPELADVPTTGPRAARRTEVSMWSDRHRRPRRSTGPPQRDGPDGGHV